ncbi:hypothetical protein [Leifsonia sp. Root4]|uniref:hypothetical protein n=1 Tax=Leifsonia sp. Root4 TaxID=1736525 RepID=UPI0012FBE9F3|nr:hypothetical protein [Leifsonia sp. Root4]
MDAPVLLDLSYVIDDGGFSFDDWGIHASTVVDDIRLIFGYHLYFAEASEEESQATIPRQQNRRAPGTQWCVDGTPSRH